MKHLYNKKINNLIMHYSNIYVNDHQFISIVDNVYTLQLSPGSSGPFDDHENLRNVFNSILSITEVNYQYLQVSEYLQAFGISLNLLYRIAVLFYAIKIRTY